MHSPKIYKFKKRIPAALIAVLVLLMISFSGGCSCRRAYWYQPKMAEPKPSATPIQPLLNRPGLFQSDCQNCIYEEVSSTDSILSFKTNIQLCAVVEEIAPSTEMIPINRSPKSEELDLSPVSTAAPEATTNLVPISTKKVPVSSLTTEPISNSVLDFPVLIETPVEEVILQEQLKPIVQAEQPVTHYLQIAETYYGMAVEADNNVDESAMNMYFDSICASWKYLQKAPQETSISKNTARAWKLYHSATARLIHIAYETKNIDKEKGLKIPANGGYRILPIEYIGFPWTADDFNEYHVVGHYSSKFLKSKNQRSGLGVPLVVVRHGKPDDRWLPKRLPFAATAIIRPSEDLDSFDATNETATAVGHIEQIAGALQIYDPKQYDNAEFRCNEVALAADTTAPYAYSLSRTDPEKKGTIHHNQPPEPTHGLFMLEPHQPGKIPVVFVHGLLSAPYTWAAMANELEAHPELASRYEIWAFQYPTDRPFLESAATLREQLHQATYEADPTGHDRPLRNMVLVGHSLGGLVAKLQVVDSQRTLWQHAAFHPYESMKASPKVANELHRAFFFQRSPFINRVVFIGTPHQGSAWAQSLIGQTTARFISTETYVKTAEHKKLLADNPALFRKEIRRRIPTSIDLLEKESMILKGIYQLEPPPTVKMHSIVGNGCWSFHDGATDGIVPVSSARLPGVHSELLVTSLHSSLNKQDATIQEVLRVLREHSAGVPSWRTQISSN